MTRLDTIGDHGDQQAITERHRRLLEVEADSLLFAEAAEVLRQQGKLTEATVVCARGLVRHPNYATGHVVMGAIFRDAGMIEKAEEHWQEALRLDPAHPQAHFHLGELHFSRADTEQAIAAFEAALSSNPSFAEAKVRLAEARHSASTAPPDDSGSSAPERRDARVRRPRWLTAARYADLVSAVTDCPSVEAAALVNSEGLPLAASASSSGQTQEEAAIGAELVLEARDLVRRLGAGRFLGALICGDNGSLRCLALGDLALVATLNSDLPAAAVEEEIEEALAGLGAGRQGYEQRHA